MKHADPFEKILAQSFNVNSEQTLKALVQLQITLQQVIDRLDDIDEKIDKRND